MHWVLAHLIGDYLLQTDWMALNKKQRSIPAFFHVAMYCLPFYLTDLALWQILLIGVQHFFQDRTGFVVWFMRIKGSEKFSTGPCAPWSIILTDNILHILFISAVIWLGQSGFAL